MKLIITGAENRLNKLSKLATGLGLSIETVADAVVPAPPAIDVPPVTDTPKEETPEVDGEEVGGEVKTVETNKVSKNKNKK